MDTFQTNLRRSLKSLIEFPNKIDGLYDFIVLNRSWISGFWNEYHASIRLLENSNKDLSLITNNTYPNYTISRYYPKNRRDLNTTIMFAQIDGVHIPQWNLSWEDLSFVDIYEMTIELDEDHDIAAIAVIAHYKNESNELLFIEVPEKFRNNGYGSILLTEIMTVIADDIFLYAVLKAETFYSKNGGILTNEYKEYKEGNLRKIIIPKKDVSSRT